MNTDKKPTAEEFSFLLPSYLWPIALRSGGWTARLVKQNRRVLTSTVHFFI